MNRLLASLALAGWVAASPGLVHAQTDTYPSRPVKAVVGWSAGGVTDISARALTQKLGERWGQPLVVENLGGGGGIRGTVAVAQAPADGYTLAIVGGSEPTIRAFVQDDAYLHARDFTPVALVAVNPIVLVANAGTSFKTVDDLRRDPRAKAGGIPFSSSGSTSTPHLIGELFAEQAGIKLKHIGYKGGAPAATAVASGEVPLGFMVLSAARPFLDAGKIRVVGVTTAKRPRNAPDLPTLDEQGVKGFDGSVWTGVYVRKGTPRPIVEKLAADLRAVLADPDVVKTFEQLGGEPGTLFLDDFGRYVEDSARQHQAIIKKLGLKEGASPAR